MTPFRPARGLGNPHLQTIFAAVPFFARETSASFRVPLPRGEWLHASAWWGAEDRRPTALLVHGLAGSSASSYIRRAAHAISHRGFHAVAIDLRGTNKSEKGSRTIYHAGLTEDIACAVSALEQDARVGRITLVGFSLGGQASLLLASQWGSAPPRTVSAVLTACAPLDLREAALRIDGPRGAVYRHWVLRGLKRNALALKKRSEHALSISDEEVLRLRRIYDFDERVTAQVHGFGTADQYYDAVSSGPRLSKIDLPTTYLYAADDPMVPIDTVTPWLTNAGPRVRIERVESGGHLGFVDRIERGSLVDTWLNRRIVRSLEEVEG